MTLTANGTSVQSFSQRQQGHRLRAADGQSLNAYAGKSVTLKWTGTEDSSLQTSFFIDDTALTLS